jgi:CelD/BcsL family acetyltransferase involved in cellulose biosynthesis
MLGFLESPDTPFVDFPVARDTDGVLAGFLNALTVRRDWDVLMVHKLPARSRSRQALEAALSGRLRWSITGTEQAPYVRISGTWEGFLREKTQRFRKTCRHIESRLRRRGGVTIEEHRKVDVEGPVFEELLQVSSQSWKAPRGVAVATMLGMPRFFRELTRRASANEWLHVWIMRLDGRAMATEYQIGADGELHALRADYDESQADLSPGAGLNLEIVRSLFERGGVQEYDMGPGANGYKLRWATGTHEMVGIRVYAPTAYGRLLYSIENRLVPITRRVSNQIRRLCA